MQPLAAYLAGVFLGGALLAPWLYWFVQAFATAILGIGTPPFHRVVHRSLLVLALLGIIPLLRRIGVRTLGDAGLARDGRTLHGIATGVALGVASLGSVAAIAVGLGVRSVAPDLDTIHLARKAFEAVATAATVAFLEEVLFRGACYTALRRSLPQAAALASSSTLYAIVHFLERAPLTGPVYWWSGLYLMPRMLVGFADLSRVVPGFLNLTLAGVLLATAYARTGNLWMSIGIHAGWIFCLRMFRAVTIGGEAVACTWCGSVKLIDGWLALIALAVVLAAVMLRSSRTPRDPQCSR